MLTEFRKASPKVAGRSTPTLPTGGPLRLAVAVSTLISTVLTTSEGLLLAVVAMVVMVKYEGFGPIYFLKVKIDNLNSTRVRYGGL